MNEYADGAEEWCDDEDVSYETQTKVPQHTVVVHIIPYSLKFSRLKFFAGYI